MQFDVNLVPNHKMHKIKNLYLSDGYFNETKKDDFLFFKFFFLLHYYLLNYHFYY